MSLYSITTPEEHVAMIIERFDEDDVPIKAGLRKQVNQNLTSLQFRTYASLQSVDPDAWSAEVKLFGVKIVETEATFSTKYDAASAADDLVMARLVALLRRDPSEGESRSS